jgi:hypothetical protein
VDQIIIFQGGDRPDCYSFLTSIKVRGTFEYRFAQQIRNRVFQRADFHHLA